MVGLTITNYCTCKESNKMHRYVKCIFRPLYVFVGSIFFAGMLGLILIQALNLDPDMIKVSGDLKIKTGVIAGFSKDGIEILNPVSNERAVYRPIMPVVENQNPALVFSFLAKAHADGQTICFMTATPEKPNRSNVAYNFHQCGNPNVGTNRAIPGKHQYVSNLRSYTTTTLIGYEDGTRAGDKGKSQLERNKYLLVSNGNSTVHLQRGITYGYPNSRYDEADIGNRFCMTQHMMVEVKFSKDMKPIGIWESRGPEAFLWTCKAANEPGQKAYIQFFE